MYVSKKDREVIRQKFGGKCAYTGTELLDDWQIDHIEPVVRNWIDGTVCYQGNHKLNNMIPAQRIINHYKHSQNLESFREFMMYFHKRLARYPKNPVVEKSVKRKAYVMEVARFFDITPEKPFSGKFYFENTMEVNKIYTEDCRETLKRMPDKFFNCCITSPPYYGLRDYNHPDQIGLEETVEEYVQKLVEIFRLVREKMKDDGTLWLNLGDSYAASGRGGHGGSFQDNYVGTRITKDNQRRKPAKGYKRKDLIGIPWMVAFALRADGWHLRQDIIWHKPNPMPEAVTDRCTKAHEYIFLLSKNERYYYDQGAIREPASNNTHERRARAKVGQKSNPDELKNGTRPPKAYRTPSGWDTGEGDHSGKIGRYPKIKNNPSFDEAMDKMPDTRNKRSVWTVNSEAFPEAHFATFPQALIGPCVLAGCPEKGIIYDPFMGGGTTALVSLRANRQFVGSEISSEYVEISMKRISAQLMQYKMF